MQLGMIGLGRMGANMVRRLQRAGTDVIEGIFRFETEVGRGFGVVRLLAAEPSKAFQLMTGLPGYAGPPPMPGRSALSKSQLEAFVRERYPAGGPLKE